MRQLLSGNAAARGSALGRARVRLPHALDVEETRIAPEDVEDELARIHDAVDVVRAEMHELRERLHGALAHEVGEFLDLHALLLDDPELLQCIDSLIRTGLYSADYALRLQLRELGRGDVVGDQDLAGHALQVRLAAVQGGVQAADHLVDVVDAAAQVGIVHALEHRRDAVALQAQGIVGRVQAGADQRIDALQQFWVVQQ